MHSVNKNLSLLFFITVIAGLYWDMTGTLIPLFIRSLNASVFQANLVLSIGGFVATASMLPSGLLCDMYGRRKVIVLGVALMILSPLFYVVADTWEETIPCTILNMAAFSLFVPARMTMIADSVRPGSLSTAYGLMNLAWPIGGILGPLIGGFIADNYGWVAFFFFVSVAALLCMPLSLLLGEPSIVLERKEEIKGKVSLDRAVALTLAVFLLFQVAVDTARGLMGAVFPFYLTETFHRSKTETGLFFSIGFGMAMLVSQFPSGLLADRLGKKKMMVYSIAPIPALALLFTFTNDYVLTLMIYTAITSLWSATWPASAAYLVDISSASRRGLMMGVRLTAVRFGFSIGPLIGGFLWDTFGAAISFYATTILYAASLVLTLLLKE